VTVNLFTQLTLLVMSLTKLTVVAPPQLSVDVTAAVFCVGTEEAQDTVTFAGQLIDGAMLSFTVMI